MWLKLLSVGNYRWFFCLLCWSKWLTLKSECKESTKNTRAARPSIDCIQYLFLFCFFSKQWNAQTVVSQIRWNFCWAAHVNITLECDKYITKIEIILNAVCDSCLGGNEHEEELDALLCCYLAGSFVLALYFSWLTHTQSGAANSPTT